MSSRPKIVHVVIGLLVGEEVRKNEGRRNGKGEEWRGANS